MEAWIAPAVSAVAMLSVAIAGGLFNLRNTRHEGREERAPDVTEAWAETERARRGMFAWQDLYYSLRGAFRGYARRMQERFGDEAELTDAEREALEFSPPRLDD